MSIAGGFPSRTCAPSRDFRCFEILSHFLHEWHQLSQTHINFVALPHQVLFFNDCVACDLDFLLKLNPNTAVMWVLPRALANVKSDGFFPVCFSSQLNLPPPLACLPEDNIGYRESSAFCRFPDKTFRSSFNRIKLTLYCFVGQSCWKRTIFCQWYKWALMYWWIYTYTYLCDLLLDHPGHINICVDRLDADLIGGEGWHRDTFFRKLKVRFHLQWLNKERTWLRNRYKVFFCHQLV